MEHLERCAKIGCAWGNLACPCDHAGGFHRENGAKALASSERAVTHGSVDGMRERIGRRQKALERSVRELRAGNKQGLYRRVHQILMINEDALRFVRVDDFVG
jgi:hypothetical protein